MEERRELRSQKSLDGDDSASEKGSVMEETNSHLYQDLLDAVLKMKDNNGRMICELFLKFPPRQVSFIGRALVGPYIDQSTDSSQVR